MATIQVSTRRITKEFRTLRNRSLVVTRRGQALGAWTPARAKPVSVDFEKRARADNSKAMPVSFAKLLSESKKV